MTQLGNTERLESILQAVVEQYIATAKPVSSKQLFDDHDFGVSPATLRNDLAELETGGYIEQPHTSAGRIPTEMGYQYYITHFLHKRSLTKRQQHQLSEAATSAPDSAVQTAKQMARAISSLTDEMVVMSIDGEEFYYTGIANMLRKPEFVDGREMMLEVSDMFEDMESVLDSARSKMEKDIEVFIGDKNPVSRHCAMIVAEYDQDGRQSVFGILGPMRMDYNHNINILQALEQFMNQQQKRL
jgi:transcriptional regulator of heat shock response